jgi:serine kinase of HPr protein (carbohydrate metabolism regulator)
VGDRGSGKTHALDAIRRCHSSLSDDGLTAVDVLGPDRASDMVGNAIGSTEDLVIMVENGEVNREE